MDAAYRGSHSAMVGVSSFLLYAICAPSRHRRHISRPDPAHFTHTINERFMNASYHTHTQRLCQLRADGLLLEMGPPRKTTKIRQGFTQRERFHDCSECYMQAAKPNARGSEGY